MAALGSSNIQISPVVMGTWQAGKQYWAGIDDGETLAALRACLDLGITSFDTAEEYGEGHSERILGKALKGRRHEAVIMTKVFSNHLGYDQVIAAAHQSLCNLDTDYIDLYQIHWPSGSWESEPVPLAETMAALRDLQAQGKIRSIGVSNFNLAQLQEARNCQPFDSLQPPYNLFWRHIERDLLPWCQEHEVTVLAYSPLAQGILADRFGQVPAFLDGDHRHANKLFLPETYPKVLHALEQLRAIAASKGVTLAQLALSWLIHQRGVCAIAGARNQTQVAANAAAMELSLSGEEWATIAAIGMEVAAAHLDDPVPWTWEP